MRKVDYAFIIFTLIIALQLLITRWLAWRKSPLHNEPVGNIWTEIKIELSKVIKPVGVFLLLVCIVLEVVTSASGKVIFVVFPLLFIVITFSFTLFRLSRYKHEYLFWFPGTMDWLVIAVLYVVFTTIYITSFFIDVYKT